MKAACQADGINPSQFVRRAIAREVKNSAEMVTLREQMDSLRAEQGKLHTAVQSLYALIDALAKVFLTCVPEPEDPAKAKLLAQPRYERFIKAVVAGLKTNGGNGQTNHTKPQRKEATA